MHSLKYFLLTFFLASCAISSAPEPSPETNNPLPEPPQEEENMESETPTSELEPTLYYPIDNFETGITLKPFGTYVNPQNSPVDPERFTGYHVAADIEVSTEAVDVPIYAIADGTVEYTGWMSGLGGVIVIQHPIEGTTYLTEYGHLDSASFTVQAGDSVTAGQQIAVLGEGYTEETDFERPHLHFSLKPNSSLVFTGYVQTEAELSAWVDPEEFFEEHEAAYVEK